jgi:hypothetical protein
MGAAIAYRRSVGARISQKPVQQFVHDSRTDLLKYGPDWLFIQVGSGDPYRNRDVVVNFSAVPVGCTFSIAFTSKGQPDEGVSVYAVFDPNVKCQVHLNGTLIAEYYEGNYFQALSPLVQYIDRGTYWKYGDFYQAPSLTLHPLPGQNTLTYTLLPAADNNGRNFYFDGIGLNLRGGPLPVTP